MNIWDWIYLILGLGLLGFGGEFLVRGASRFARTLGLSSLVVGVTVVAVGTSAPELAVSLHAALSGEPDVSIGNVIGSNLLNLLVVLGAAAVVVPLVVAQRLVWWDIPIMIVATGLVWFFARDGHLSRGDGVGLLALLIGYLIAAVRISTGESAAVRAEYDQEFGEQAQAGWRGLSREILLMLGGLALLVGGAEIFVEGAIGIARSLGVSELIISLTIVAIGTSLPELVTALVAATRGENDIAVGNVVGSNIMNLLAILGLTALIAPGGLAVPAAVLAYDMPFLLLVSVACLPFLGSGHKLSRGEGVVFLIAYAVYVVWLLFGS